MLDAAEVVFNLIGCLADIGPTLIGPDDDIRFREVLVGLGLMATMVACAVALSSWIVAGAGVTVPWIVGARLRQARQRYSGLDSGYERHQRYFYTAIALSFGMLLAWQTTEAYYWAYNSLPVAPTIWPPIPHTALAHSLVAATFPAALLVFWYARNRVQAISGGLIASIVLAQGLDQILRGSTAALPSGTPIAIYVLAVGGTSFALSSVLRKSVIAVPLTRDGKNPADLRHSG